NVGTVGSGANGGTLIVSGANGAINSTSAVFITGVSAGGTTSKLNLDNSTSVAERINNSATVTTSLGGEFVLTNNATTKTVETIGGLTIGAGTSTITLSGGGTTLLHELVVGSSGFTRTDNGTALIRGIAYNSAAASVSLLSVDKTNISGGGTGLTLIGTNISSVGYKGNTATSASTRNLKIVPYLLATYSATGSGFGFLTYDTNATTGGLRLLSSFEIQSLNSTTSSYNASGENVAIAGNTTFANPGSLTFNSLNMSATAALNAKSTSDTLTITSGAVMALGATTSIGTFDKLNLDNGEGVFLVGDGVTFTVSSRVDVTSGGTHSVSGGITKGGNGALVLNAANLFTGPIIINSGSVKYGVSGSLQATNTVATASGAVFDISAKSPTLAGMNNVGGTGGTVTNTSTATASTLTLGGSGAYDFAGVITATTVANMALNVALTGNGSQSLSGSSTYTGATAVSSGKLFVNGSLSASSAVSVASGATLGGGGSVGAVTVTGPGSVIAPGAANASGKLTVSSLTAATGTHMQFQVGATSGTPNSDQLAVTGAFAGTTATDSQDIVIDLEVVGSGPVAGATYTLITFGSSSSLTAGDFALGSHDGLTLSTTGFDTDGVLDGIFFDSANKQVQVQFSAVPEPTSLSLIGGVVAGLLVRRRRKQ
ncbi:MAG TPA: PEP-CTERM sorting domain-containing protein, partial [Roseimicrobium sp.]|nr:PEP-CTERM sorting domain-containing protein [Roseimicrobium sp.]